MTLLRRLNPAHFVALGLLAIAQIIAFSGSWILFNEAEVPESLREK